LEVVHLSVIRVERQEEVVWEEEHEEEVLEERSLFILWKY
jgi:hypothetical protein